VGWNASTTTPRRRGKEQIQGRELCLHVPYFSLLTCGHVWLWAFTPLVKEGGQICARRGAETRHPLLPLFLLLQGSRREK